MSLPGCLKRCGGPTTLCKGVLVPSLATPPATFLVAWCRLTCRRDTMIDFYNRGLRTPQLQAATCSMLVDL